jgi:hypothetical protein
MNEFTINITFPKDAEGAPSHIQTDFLPRVGDIITGRQLNNFRYVVTEVVLEIRSTDDGKTEFGAVSVRVERPQATPE